VTVPLNKLNYSFSKKPLLVGGMAMEYYGLRKSGPDIDFVAVEEDVVNLIKLYPERVKDLWGDLGVCPFEFEIWKTICLFDYDELSKDAIDEGEYLVISLEKLLFMKALAMKKEKYLKDTQLIVQDILDRQNKLYNRVDTHNRNLLVGIEGINYIEKAGPTQE
jgi:hypothetical protein